MNTWHEINILKRPRERSLGRLLPSLHPKGYDHTTIQDIVDALGMSKGAVYHHFKSKEDILDHLYDRYYVDSKMFDVLDAPSRSGLEKLRELRKNSLVCPSFTGWSERIKHDKTLG